MTELMNYASAESSHANRIKTIGANQRNLTVVVIGLIALHFLVALSAYLGALLLLGVIVAAVLLFRLMSSMGVGATAKWLTMLCLFIPLVNIIAVVVVNHKACEILRAAGLRVGFIGVSEEDLKNYN